MQNKGDPISTGVLVTELGECACLSVRVSVKLALGECVCCLCECLSLLHPCFACLS